jgi:hypothetical protein
MNINIYGPRAPGVGDTVEKWELWIEKYVHYLIEKGEEPPFHLHKKFNTYKTKEIKSFGINWGHALKWGDDKKYIKIMENNWKFTTYLDFKGNKPRTFEMKSYL